MWINFPLFYIVGMVSVFLLRNWLITPACISSSQLLGFSAVILINSIFNKILIIQGDPMSNFHFIGLKHLLTPPNDMSFFFPLSWRKKFLVFIPEVCFSSPLYLSYSHKHFYKTSIVVASSGRQTHALLYTVQFFGTHSQSNTLFYVSFLPSVYLSVITYHILF